MNRCRWNPLTVTSVALLLCIQHLWIQSVQPMYPYGLLGFYQSKCLITDNLQSQYMTAIRNDFSEMVGCLSKRTKNKFQEVHIISLISSGFNETSPHGFPTVSLNLKSANSNEDYKGTVAVILRTTLPVTWNVNVEFVDNSSEITLVTTHNSQSLHYGSFNFKDEIRRKKPSLSKLVSWAQRKFGSVTTITKIEVANEITINLGSVLLDTNQIEKQCNASSLRKSKLIKTIVDAVYSRTESASGCSPPLQSPSKGTADQKKKAIYVIELTNPPGETAEIQIKPYGYVVKSRVPVLRQDIILVLFCSKRISWSIEAWGFQGDIEIHSRWPVMDERLLRQNNRLSIVDFEEVPGPDEIVKYVEENIGEIRTYIKANDANKVLILLENKLHESLSYSSTQFPSPFSTSVTSSDLLMDSEESRYAHDNEPKLHNRVPKFHSGVLSRNLLLRTSKSSEINSPIALSLSQFLMDRVKIQCPAYDSNVGIHVQIPVKTLREVARLAFGISSNFDESQVDVTLQNCDGTKKDGHLVFETEDPNSCGTLVSTVNGQNIYENQLMFWHKISTQSKRALGNPLGFAFPAIRRPQGTQYTKPITKSELIFPLSFQCTNESNVSFLKGGLKLYQDSNFSSLLTATPSFEFQSRVKDKVFVDAGIVEGRKGVGALLEECWASEHNSPLFVNDTSKTCFIKKRCSKSGDVHFVDRTRIRSKFSWQLNESLANKSIFIHCKIIYCIQSAKAEPNDVPKTMSTCSYEYERTTCPYNDTEKRLPSTYFSIESIGPIVVIASNESVVRNSRESTTDPPGVKVEKDTSVVDRQSSGLNFVFVSIIAGASFAVGASLMAFVWFMNTRKDPVRKFAKRRSKQGSSSQTSSASSSSSPSSSSFGPEPGGICKNPKMTCGFDLTAQSQVSSPSSQRRISIETG